MRTLNEAYDRVYTKQYRPPKNLQSVYLEQVADDEQDEEIEDINIPKKDALIKLSGISSKSALLKLVEIYNIIKNDLQFSEILTNQIYFSKGSDKSRIYKSEDIISQSTLIEISKNDFDNNPLVITYAGNIRKIRTPAPSNKRIAEFNNISDSNINKTYESIKNKNIINSIHTSTLRVLCLYDLYIEYPSLVKLIPKTPPGIGAEFAQVEEFNIALEDLSPVKFFIKHNSKNENQNVKINKARKISGSGKADIELVDTKSGKAVYWISFKDGEYDVNKRAPFQQYGSLKRLYDNDRSVHSIIDSFLHTITKNLPSVDFPLTQKDLKIINQNPAMEDLWNTHGYKFVSNRSKSFKPLKDVVRKIHFYTQGTPELYLDLFNKKNKMEHNLISNLALKSIYGSEYEMGKKTPFSRENVNIVLQAPNALSLKPLIKDEEIEAVVLDIKPGAHLIKNPQMPESENYLPCLYSRFTKNEFFFFNNNTECILGIRPFIYPISNASSGKSKEIFLK
jgi:hypothetical protein